MQHAPLLFEYQDLIAGNGFLAGQLCLEQSNL